MDDDDTYNHCIGTGSTHAIDGRRYRNKKLTIGFVHHGKPGRGIEPADPGGGSGSVIRSRKEPHRKTKQHKLDSGPRTAKATRASPSKRVRD